MTRSFEYFVKDDFEREAQKELIYVQEKEILEELEYEEWRKRSNFEVRDSRKPNSKYGRAKIIRKTSRIRTVCKTCKHKSTSLQRDDEYEYLY